MPTRVNRLTVDLSASIPTSSSSTSACASTASPASKPYSDSAPKSPSPSRTSPTACFATKTSLFSLFPAHAGMRQYWRDMDSLLAWTRSDPHRLWWKNFLRDSGGTGFWHETYTDARRYGSHLRRHRSEDRLHVLRPVVPARGSMFTAAHRSAAARALRPSSPNKTCTASDEPRLRHAECPILAPPR